MKDQKPSLSTIDSHLYVSAITKLYSLLKTIGKGTVISYMEIDGLYLTIVKDGTSHKWLLLKPDQDVDEEMVRKMEVLDTLPKQYEAFIEDLVRTQSNKSVRIDIPKEEEGIIKMFELVGELSSKGFNPESEEDEGQYILYIDSSKSLLEYLNNKQINYSTMYKKK